MRPSAKRGLPTPAGGRIGRALRNPPEIASRRRSMPAIEQTKAYCVPNTPAT
jgi:hypothetical protein